MSKKAQDECCEIVQYTFSARLSDVKRNIYQFVLKNHNKFIIMIEEASGIYRGP